MQLSLEDLDTLTENRALCNDDGELDLASFERLIRYQLQAHLSFPFLRTGTSSTPCLPSLHWHPLAPTLYLRFVRHVHRRMQHLNALVSKHRLRANLLSHAEITPGSSTSSVS